MDGYDLREFRESVYVFAMAVGCLCRLEGMKSENALRALNNESPAYGEKFFEDLRLECGMHHNAIMGNFNK